MFYIKSYLWSFLVRYLKWIIIFCVTDTDAVSCPDDLLVGYMFATVHQQNDPGISSHELYSCCSATHLPQGRGIHLNDRVIEIFEWPSDILLLKFALPFSIFNCFYFLIGLILCILFFWKKYGEQNACRKDFGIVSNYWFVYREKRWDTVAFLVESSKSLVTHWRSWFSWFSYKELSR